MSISYAGQEIIYYELMNRNVAWLRKGMTKSEENEGKKV